MIINDNSVETLRRLDRKKLEVAVVDEVPQELTEKFTMVYNRTNQTLYICDTEKWVALEGTIL